MIKDPTPKTDAWCELAMSADVSAVLELAKDFERELAREQRRSKNIAAHIDNLMEIVEGVRGERWAADGRRLVDTPEWCALYVAARNENVPALAQPEKQNPIPNILEHDRRN